MEKKPRGRPATECDKITNMKKVQRKSPEKKVKATLKVCDERKTHKVKPCAIVNKKCVAKTETKPGSCGDVRPKPKTMFKGKKEQKADLVKRCAAKAVETGKKCTVPNKKKLVCHDATIKVKSKDIVYIPGAFKY